MIGLFYEELEIGRVIELGAYHFSPDNIARFSSAFTPVPFHLNREDAEAGLFGRTAAAGFHTCCGWMTCFVATNARERARRQALGKRLPDIGPSPGTSAIRWPRPVHAGDVISYRSAITAKRNLASRPNWGLVTMLCEGMNQKGDLVVSFVSKVLVAKD